VNWNGRQVLVTGAGGFIGSHLCERLLALGARVRAMVHGDKHYHARFLTQLPEDHASDLEIRGGDVRDGAFVGRCMEAVDTAFHLAAVAGVAYSYGHPHETVQTNTLGTLAVCEAARTAGVRRLVHTSSAGVYGSALERRPIPEGHPVYGCNPYTAGKLGGDFVAEAYHRSYDLPVAVIRPFNAYGPRMGPYLIIPNIILQALEGAEIRLGNLAPMRNYTYVDDMVSAFIAMAERDEAVGEIVHFGSPDAISMGDLAKRILDLMDSQARIVCDEARLRPERSEIHWVAADCAKARLLLDWAPQVGLDDGLRRTIEWVAAGGYDNL